MRRTVLAAAIAVALLPASARAQYFGQNKVVYNRFDFQIIETPHFDVYYYGRERAAAMDAARMAERGYARLSRILNHEWRERKPLILYASLSDFVQTNTVSGDLGEGTGGVTEVFKHRMVLPFTGSYADFEHVLQHEMVHAFQYDVFSRGRPGAIGGLQSVNPSLWFVEGMAEYLSLGPIDAHTAMWVRDAAVEGPFPSIEEMTWNPRIFPYRFGHALWAYIGQKWGDETIGAILQGTMAGGIDRAFQRVLGLSLEELSEEWRDAVRATYLPQVQDNLPARRFARVVLNQKRSQGNYHVSPQLSPDGSRIVYLSERNFFFVDLWLADAENGRALRRLVRSNLDPNYESLRFVYSSGAWSPDGTQFVFAAKRGGEDLLNILEVRSGRVVARFSVGAAGVTNPSYSPDGTKIVFTALDGGVSDLWVVDADGRNVRRLTSDRYANLLPQWSPDGRTIAFTTDQGPDTDFDALRFGNMRIALFDLDGDSVISLPRMDLGRNINPVWAPDGQSFAFISDRSGVPNVFLYDLAGHEVFQITRVLTGVIGITEMSPALSWARTADRLVFSTFEHGDYNAYAIDNPRALRREPFRPDPVTAIALANAAAQPLRLDAIQGRGLRRPDAAALAAVMGPRPGVVAPAAAPVPAPGAPSPSPATPPGNPPAANPPAANPPAAGNPPTAAPAPGPTIGSIYRSGNRLRPSDTPGAAGDSAAPPPVNVAALLDSASLSLLDTSEFTLRPYRVRFTPDFVSRPSIGYARDNFGRGFFGGTAIQLSDILGDRSMLFSAAVNGRISEAQLFAAYVNQTRRLNWAAGVSQEPLFFYGSSTYDPDYQGTGFQVINQQLRRLVFREAFAQASYPVNRFKRVELGGRLVNVSQATLNQLTFYDQFGQFYGVADSTSNEGSVTFVQPTAALVFDNSLFGFTSPFFGHRYRFEVSPSFGNWHYTQALADYRRYDMLFAPFFTFATRALFLGRFGRDGDQFPVFLGSPELVRGYTYGSFRSSECSQSSIDISSRTGCPEVDQLIGSRVAVVSAEFRFPLIRNLALGFLPIGFPPIEGAFFAEAGMAWNKGADLRWSRTAGVPLEVFRAPVTSYGFGLRANLFGFAVIRLDYAVPRERPAKGGYWMVSLGPPF